MIIKHAKRFLSSTSSPRQTVIKNSAWLFAAEGVAKTLRIVLTICIARYLGPSVYGEYSFAYSFGLLFVIFADFGFNKLFIREVSRQKEQVKKFLDNISAVKLLLSVITYVLIVIVIHLLGKPLSTRRLVYLASIWIIMSSFTVFFQSVFQAFEQMQYDALIRIIQPAGFLMMALIVIWQDCGVVALVSVDIVAGIITFASVVMVVTKKFVRFGIEFDVGFIKNVLCEAWPFAIMVICGTIYFSIDIMLLSYFKDDYSVGIYSACVDIYKAAVIPSAIVCTALFPRLSIKAHIGGEGYTKILKKLVILQVLLGSLIAIMICIFAHHAIMILYGKGFEESIGYLRVILVLVPIRYLNFIVGDSLSALNIQRKRMWAIFICMVFNFTTNLYFIPLYGIAGAIGTTIATECLLAGQYWFYTLKTVQRKRIV